MDLNFGFKGACHFVTSSEEEKSSDGWMMRNLLQVDRASVHPTLEGLTENRVEGFLHVEIEG